MKKWFLSLLIVFITVFIVSLPSFCLSKQPDPNVWELLSDNFYYNKTNLITSEDIVSVWTYRTIADEERKYLIEHFKESDVKKSTRYQNLDHQTMLLDMDCRKKLSKIEKLTNYDGKGNVLYEETYQNSEWTTIVSESKLGSIYRRICVTSEAQEKIIALKNKCEKECKSWATAEQEKLFSDKFTHQNHYNTKRDKCFILINYFKKQSKILKDMNDNKIYGSFRSRKDGTTIICNVSEKTCISEAEWDSFVKPYMEE